MRISHIITRSDSIGGAQVHVRDLALELVNSGFDVDILVGGNGPYIKELADLRLKVSRIPHLVRSIRPVYDLLALLEIRRALASIRPVLVAAHTAKAGWLGRIAAWSLGLPCVYNPHGWAFAGDISPWKRWLYLTLERFASLFSSRIIAVSGCDRDLCLRYRLAPPERIVTVRNGVRDEPGLQEGNVCSFPPRLVMVSRLEKPKNHALLLQSSEPLKDLEWRMELAGDGPLRGEIEEWVQRLDLSSIVSLLGERRDIEEVLKGAWGFVLISDWEGLPLSILEAMRAGLPVIASDVGGVREAVEEGVNGFLIPSGDKSLLSARLRQLIQDPVLRDRMGQESRRKFRQEFTLSRMVEETLAAYYEAVTRCARDQEKAMADARNP